MRPKLPSSYGTRFSNLRPPIMIASIGIAVPIENAKVTSKARKVIALLSAKVMTLAIIGPTHGDHSTPSVPPLVAPPRQPSRLTLGLWDTDGLRAEAFKRGVQRWNQQD